MFALRSPEVVKRKDALSAKDTTWSSSGTLLTNLLLKASNLLVQLRPTSSWTINRI